MTLFFGVQNEHQCVLVFVASPVKVSNAETAAASSRQKHKPFPAELVEERRKGRDGAQGIDQIHHFWSLRKRTRLTMCAVFPVGFERIIDE
jgi:hypothetical protein